MSSSDFQIKSGRTVSLLLLILSMLIIGGCGVEAAKVEDKIAVSNSKNQLSKAAASETETLSQKATIQIRPDSPADTIKVFYAKLRARRFREAMFLTNLRFAVEGLTDDELKDLQVDFEPLANQIPTDIEINGEIISNNKATVTAKLPDNETGEVELQQINLRRENGVWVILTVDETAEAMVKKEGTNYFRALRIETHHNEARAMLNRIAKAQMIFAAQNKGIYGALPDLVEKKLLPDDARTPQTTGYIYQIELSADKTKYAAFATPAVYDKTGKLSFWFEANGSKNSSLNGKDLKGKTPKI